MKIFYTLFMVVSILSSQTINEQIQALEEATPTERVALMNHIKEQLIEMNQNERTETIHLLKAQFHNESRVDEHGHEVLSSEHLSQEQEIHEHQLHQHHIKVEERQEEHEHQESETSEPHHSELER